MHQLVVQDYWRNRHGFPQGYHFMPKPAELIDLLADKLAGRPLPQPLSNIFHDVRIRAFNPDDLHERYQEHEEAGHIYFFSEREFAKPGGNKKRPARRTTKGGWKASGGAKAVTNAAGVDIGQKLTMVFYEERFSGDKYPTKTEWGMHEFTKIIGPNNKLADMAVYCLYKMRCGREKKASQDVATILPGAGKLTVTAPPSLQPANQAIDRKPQVSTSRAQAQARVGQLHCHHGNMFGPAAVAPAPGHSGSVMPAASRPPVQQQQQHSTGPPAPTMASGVATAANCTSMSGQLQQRQAAGQFGYARPGDWRMPQQMVLSPHPPLPSAPMPELMKAPAPRPASHRPLQQQQLQAGGQLDYARPGDWRMPPQMTLSQPPTPPPPPKPVPLMAPVLEPSAHCQQQQQQQEDGEQFDYPELTDCHEQLLKIDLPPPLPPPALAAGEYMVDEFSAWLNAQDSSLEEDPWFPMTDEESQLCTFTMEELLGSMDDTPAAAPATATMMAEEADASNQVQDTNQQQPIVAAN